MMHIRRRAPLFVAVLLAGLMPNVVPASTPVAEDVSSPAPGNTAFAADLYGKLRETKGNLFFSPHSISAALAMTYAGARGNTEAEMRKTLHFAQSGSALHAGFAALDARLATAQKSGKIELSVASSLWPQKQYPFLPEFLALTRKHYGAAVNPVDFQASPDAARGQINEWVETRTKKKIRDLIPPDAIGALTRLVLVNAIYFKGLWASPFEAGSTREEPFFAAGGAAVQVPMMNATVSAGYAEQAGVQILELPYAGGDLAMVVVLPKQKKGLPALERTLNAAQWRTWCDRLTSRAQVQVSLPKFRVTSQFSLKDALTSLGMRDAFDPDKADFSGMDGRQKWLFISAVLHKAFVDVNEKGTEAAAATAVIVVPSAMPEPPSRVFRADHPFLFGIRDTATGSLLFLGRIENPAL